MIDTKALREKVLDLAIRGKLVEQDPNDEPAFVLLERIRAEKQQMVKDGKLKAKDIKNDTIIYKGDDNLHYEQFADGTVGCIEDELGYTIPNGWSITTVGSVCTMQAGKFIPASDISPICLDGMYPCYGGNGIRGFVDHYLVEGDYPIIGRQGALCGNVNMTHGKFYATEHAVVVTPMLNIDLNWLYYTLIGLNLNQYSAGAAQPGLAVSNLLKVRLLLPPLNEQKRIANAINEALSIIQTVDKYKQDLALIIQSVKSKILDLAIRGKLVPQDPNDEPASVLLERIRAEKEELIKQGKIKRDKKESIIFKGDDNSYYEKMGNTTVCIDEELPFEIPDNWTWSRLQTCCCKDIKRGKSPKYANSGNALVFAQKCNTKYDGINLNLALFLDETTIEKYSDTEFMQNNDIVINSTGNGTLGRVGIYKDINNTTSTPIVPDSHVTVIRSNNCIMADYLYAFLKSSQSVLEKMGEGSTNQKELKPITLKNMLVPIPPYKEQMLIVDIIKKVNIIISNVEANLN
ncbi:MAG: restriction endonuclease subunit S [Ruminococcus sp.]